MRAGLKQGRRAKKKIRKERELDRKEGGRRAGSEREECRRD